MAESVTSDRPFVSVASVRQRVAAAIAALPGGRYREVPYPMSVDAAPAGFASHPFSLAVDRSQADGRFRRTDRDGVRVITRLGVLLLTTLTPSEGEQLTALDVATDAEEEVLRLLLASDGDPWRWDLRIDWIETIRVVQPDDGAFILSTLNLSVSHALSLR